MSFLNKVFREILNFNRFFQSLGRFRLGVGVSFSADTPVTGFADTFVLVRLLPKQPHRITGIYSSYSVFIPAIRNLRKPPSFEF